MSTFFILLFPVFPFHQLRERKDNVKLGMSESTDLWFVRETGSKSYASLLVKPGETEHAVNLAVSPSLSRVIHTSHQVATANNATTVEDLCVCAML